MIFALHRSEASEDEAEIVFRAAEDGIDAVTLLCGEEIPGEPPIVFHVTDDRFDGACAFSTAAFSVWPS